MQSICLITMRNSANTLTLPQRHPQQVRLHRRGSRLLRVFRFLTQEKRAGEMQRTTCLREAALWRTYLMTA